MAMRPAERQALHKTKVSGQHSEQVEKIKASIRAKVERPVRAIAQRSRIDGPRVPILTGSDEFICSCVVQDMRATFSDISSVNLSSPVDW